MKKVIAVILLCVFVLIATRSISLSGSEPLNQEFCQYPHRTTNSEGGCDNSDPCDPQSAVKGGSGECADYIEPPQTPTLSEIPASHNNNTEVVTAGK